MKADVTQIFGVCLRNGGIHSFQVERKIHAYVLEYGWKNKFRNLRDKVAAAAPLHSGLISPIF